MLPRVGARLYHPHTTPSASNRHLRACTRAQHHCTRSPRVRALTRTRCCSATGDRSSSSWALILIPAALDIYFSSCTRWSLREVLIRPRRRARSADLREAACRMCTGTMLPGVRLGLFGAVFLLLTPVLACGWWGLGSGGWMASIPVHKLLFGVCYYPCTRLCQV